MKNAYLMMLFALIISSSSCNVKCTTNPSFCLSYVGFNNTEQSVVVYEEYQKNTNFTVRTGIYEYASKYRVSNDTTYEPDLYILSDHDYIIDLPLAGRSFKIRDLSYEQISGPYPGSDWTCDNAAWWYVNDTPQTYSGTAPVKHGSDQCAMIELKK